MLRLTLVVLVAAVAQAQVYTGLRVKWGVPAFDSYAYNAVPRTVAEAEADGWVSLGGCNGLFFGERFVKYDDNLGDFDYIVMPLYDINGFIAGIQMATPQENGFPNQELIPPFQYDPQLQMYMLTAYFVNPDLICTSGRSQADFDRQGTGDRIVVQKGGELIELPYYESDIGSTDWTRGKCFSNMGQHYWFDVSKETKCEEFQPLFLLYNDNILNGFGWAMIADLPSPRLEHPSASALPSFLPDEYPDCLNDVPMFSTLHIYMTDNPQQTHGC